ncbi:hypothetical protein PRIC2_010973 [Phytophthora ramorum]
MSTSASNDEPSETVQLQEYSDSDSTAETIVVGDELDVSVVADIDSDDEFLELEKTINAPYKIADSMQYEGVHVADTNDGSDDNNAADETNTADHHALKPQRGKDDEAIGSTNGDEIGTHGEVNVAGKHVVVQQDNAPAHIPETDTAFAEAARASGCNVVLRNQPPNSPDMNVNDLGLFSAVQARQRKKRTRTINELIEAAVSSYWELPMRTINAAFLSLQGSLDDCIAQAGDNNYKPRHMKRRSFGARVAFLCKFVAVNAQSRS